MKEVSVSVRIKDEKTDLIQTIYVTKEEIEQLACNKAREEYPEVRSIYSDGISSIQL